MLVISGILGVWVVGRRGGYVSLDHFILQFTKVSYGVGGVG